MFVLLPGYRGEGGSDCGKRAISYRFCEKLRAAAAVGASASLIAATVASCCSHISPGAALVGKRRDSASLSVPRSKLGGDLLSSLTLALFGNRSCALPRCRVQVAAVFADLASQARSLAFVIPACGSTFSFGIVCPPLDIALYERENGCDCTGKCEKYGDEWIHSHEVIYPPKLIRCL
ncbi:hypothetical protein Krac_3785 [Ktedonobacter racemifer DSM 44963]|uniref:Uncharacterized protein n=1 Tax=Ktedonobacter racemifer DSM 44963 TaxID=485913 RepID=D6U2Z8_KTERA|nr:hypothetical protein Krac_3785 [Ktedonobacter racemifer DSM 44963]